MFEQWIYNFKERCCAAAMRVEAFKALSAEVRSGAYPEEKHMVNMKDEEFEAFLKGLGKRP